MLCLLPLYSCKMTIKVREIKSAFYARCLYSHTASVWWAGIQACVVPVLGCPLSAGGREAKGSEGLTLGQSRLSINIYQTAPCRALAVPVAKCGLMGGLSQHLPVCAQREWDSGFMKTTSG